jgi:hypothetical protein
MTFQSKVDDLLPSERRDYGFARVRDVAFDAIRELWVRRKNEGMRQVEIAGAIGRDPGWVSRTLRGPGNLTLRSIGEMVEALGGEIEIRVHALEDPLPSKPNFDAYSGYRQPAVGTTSTTVFVETVQ